MKSIYGEPIIIAKKEFNKGNIYGGLIFGFDTAVISGAEEQIQEQFHLSDAALGFTVTTALIGTIVGAIVSGRLADRFGRKKVLYAIGVLYVVSAVGCAFAPTSSVEMLQAFRFLGGLGIGASSVCAPIYTAEIAPPKFRGRLVGLVQFNIVLGILVAYASNAIIRTILGDVHEIDIEARTVTSRSLSQETVTPYDSLIIAAGAGQSYFGNDHFARYAPGMKDIDNALELRGRIFGAFELAETTTDPEDRERLLTFVVVGAGPTGVEMAGQIAELSHKTLAHEFRHINPRDARVILLDGAPQVLPSFGDRLGGKTRASLEKRGVEVQLGAMVTEVDGTGIEVKDKDGTVRRIEAMTKVWAAGVAASPLGKMIADQAGAEVDRAGRVHVEEDLTVKGHPEIFLVGDMINLKGYPGVAQLAIQGGRYAAKEILGRLEGKEPQAPFVYKDKGSMATISKYSAVASIGKIKLTGFIAWLAWLAVRGAAHGALGFTS